MVSQWQKPNIAEPCFCWDKSKLHIEKNAKQQTSFATQFPEVSELFTSQERNMSRRQSSPFSKLAKQYIEAYTESVFIKIF